MPTKKRGRLDTSEAAVEADRAVEEDDFWADVNAYQRKRQHTLSASSGAAAAGTATQNEVDWSLMEHPSQNPELASAGTDSNGDLYFPRKHRRQWDDGMSMEVEADPDAPLAAATRPAQFRTLQQMLENLGGFGEPPKQAPEGRQQTESSSSSSSSSSATVSNRAALSSLHDDHRRDDSEREAIGVGVGIEYDPDNPDEVTQPDDQSPLDRFFETMRRDASNKWSTAFPPPYRSNRQKNAIEADLDLADDFVQLKQCHLAAKAAAAPRFLSRYDIYVKGITGSDGMVQGATRFNNIYEEGYTIAFANDGPMSSMQQDYYDMNMTACAPLIHDKDWLYCKEDFLARFGLYTIHPYVAALTPRQFGKTTIVAIVALALVLNTMLNIIIFSAGLDTSKRLLDAIKTKGRKYMGEAFDARLGTDSKEAISVVSEADARVHTTAASRDKVPEKASVKSLPATDKGSLLLLFSLLFYLSLIWSGSDNNQSFEGFIRYPLSN